MSIQRTFTSLFGALSLAALLLPACKRDDDIDLKDPVPQVLAVTVSPTTVHAFQDSVVFLIQYRDGDGDLGENTPSAKNLFLVDNRIGITETYRVQELAPNGADIPITGTLRVILPSTGTTNGSSSQSATFTVYLRDRAGHESNHFVTTAITITQ